MSVGIISSVADYQIQEELYGGDVGFIGYPVADGSGTAVAFRGSDVAINAKQENQAGAWEFVKFYLLHGYDGQGFPIMKQQFDQVMAAAMEEDYLITEDGGTERDSKGSYYDGDEWMLANTFQAYSWKILPNFANPKYSNVVRRRGKILGGSLAKSQRELKKNSL